MKILIRVLSYQDLSIYLHYWLPILHNFQATIETAFIGTPFIIVYKTSNISYQIGKHFIKIDKIGLPNIILEKDVIPELIQDEVNAENIHSAILGILTDGEKYNRISNELKALHNILGSRTPSTEVTNIIGKLIHE